MENGKEKSIRLAVEEEVKKAIESSLRDSKEEERVRLPGGEEMTVSCLRGGLKKEQAPCWWPSLCETLLRDAAEVILSGTETGVSEVCSSADPIAAAYKKRAEKLKEMGVKDPDMAYGEKIFTAEEHTKAVICREGIGVILRRSFLYAAVIRNMEI
ncbi:MAG TPA: hypothetical protein VJB41_00140 [Patescibacteria group bacterium]|nr:hypothetical protein [Patescibacteria group bacterium]